MRHALGENGEPIVQPRIEHEIGKNIEGQGKVVIQDFGTVTDDFLTRKGIQVAADGVHLLGNLFGRAPAGALEQQVLDEMSHTVQFRRFAAGARLHPDPHGNGTDMRHALGENGEPIVQHVLFDILHGVRVLEAGVGFSGRLDCGCGSERICRAAWVQVQTNISPVGFQRGELTPPRTKGVDPSAQAGRRRSGHREERTRFPAARGLCRSTPEESPGRLRPLERRPASAGA